MDSQKNLPLFQLGYLNSQSVNPVEFNGNTNTTTITSPPVFISQNHISISQEIRSDEIMECLLQYGYIVENRVYDGKYPSYLTARTRFGDRIFIHIDDNKYKMSFPLQSNDSDIQMEKQSSLVIVPQETKMGVLQCSNFHICAAAFVRNNGICITQRNQQNLTEENFVVQVTGNSEFIERGIFAYPIVLLSEIIRDPIGNEERISLASREISKIGFDRLRGYQKDLADAINQLNMESKNLTQLIDEVEVHLSIDIQKLSSAYEKIKQIPAETLRDNDQADYYAIQRGLIRKKDLQNRFLDQVANAYSISESIHSISAKLRNKIDPIINEYKNLV